MKVKHAKKIISDISAANGKAVTFCARHEELYDETDFIADMVMHLGDYKKLLEQAIEEAELTV
jgi:hypothetical protein